MSKGEKQRIRQIDGPTEINIVRGREGTVDKHL